MIINQESSILTAYKHFLTSTLPLKVEDQSLTSYQLLAFAADIFAVLVDQEVQNPVQVLIEMLEQKTIKDIPKLFIKQENFHKVSPSLPFYQTLKIGSIPIYGVDYITGQLKQQDAAMLCNKLEFLEMKVTEIFDFFRSQDVITIMPYCLNKEPEFASKCGFDYIIKSSEDSNKMEHVTGIVWI
ncbi:hypothetical protein SS50377_26866 [Spironucleus salmonicida]|uniref:Uncharacterized protein n=1 Tax=Spironucleus salmonicida TaxID=348837 RepID=V6LYK3_9EUKA|nr:hypothetical protein SS50377_26866 [Spironucleus salmonicida]|eukprot:EST49333.1 Hypothetical protein SS50377_10560 [Spironucleus salmonicida]